jgi:enoyl-CoA hydratase/carnithine racemase
MALVEIQRQGSVALVRFDRGGSANALNADLMHALIDAARDIARASDVNAVVLTGAPKIFAGGVDLKDQALWMSDGEPQERTQAMNLGGEMVDAWRRVPQPVIAAIEGPAIGGGGILALTADFRVMGASSYLRFPEVKLGMTFAWGGLALLVERVGSSAAKRILFADERIDPEAARTMGLCDRAAPDGSVVEEALAWASDIAALPPYGVRMTKAGIDAHCRQNWAAPYEADQFYQARRLTEGKTQA